MCLVPIYTLTKADLATYSASFGVPVGTTQLHPQGV